MKPVQLVRVAGASICFISALTVKAQDHNDSSRNYLSQATRGGVGLLQTPTARMAAPGNFSLNYNDIEQYRFWSASLQLMPWMESTVRYTDVRTRRYSPYESFSGDQTLKDKGIDVKFRLFKESFYVPEISVGFLDIGGTGFFRSEFVNASKAFGPIDLHLGVGTGYLGNSGNISSPFCKVADRFCERPSGYGGLGGKIDYDQFFKGETSLFGGIEYRSPIKNLILKLEYDGNDYLTDRAGTLEQKSKWNFGAVYKYKAWDFNLNYQRGDVVGFGVSYNFNLDTATQVKFDSPPRSLEHAEPAASMATLDRRRMYNEMASQGKFLLSATHQVDNEMIFYGTQLGYRDHDEASQRVGRILAYHMPEDITSYSIVESSGNIAMLETKIDAQPFKVAARYEDFDADIKDTYIRQDPREFVKERKAEHDGSGLSFGVESFWIQTFGSPEAFYLYQGGVFVNTGYALNSNFRVQSGIKVNVLENFDKFKFRQDAQGSSLPRVRTLVREYVGRRRITLENAYLHWFDEIAKDTYAQAYAGYLETMFGGIGGEVLYRPVDSEFAFGLDLNYAKQRDYASETAFFEYSVLTGHASMYWTPSSLPNMQLTMKAGQFLAKDKGVNIDIAKRFDSGIIVGAYAAFTNVSAEEYGEGSFTKGFYMSIPFDMFTFAPSKGRGKIPWIPIGRDGGQMLKRPVSLKDMTEIRSPFYD